MFQFILLIVILALIFLYKRQENFQRFVLDSTMQDYSQKKPNIERLIPIQYTGGVQAFNRKQQMASGSFRDQQMAMLNSKGVCYQNHKHESCGYGSTNHLDPNDMNAMDKKLFKYNYQENMTNQDYVNWLWLYKDDSDKLPYEHLRNFDRIKNGQPLDFEQGVTPPPKGYEGRIEFGQYCNELFCEEPEPVNKTVMGYNFEEI